METSTNQQEIYLTKRSFHSRGKDTVIAEIISGSDYEVYSGTICSVSSDPRYKPTSGIESLQVLNLRLNVHGGLFSSNVTAVFEGNADITSLMLGFDKSNPNEFDRQKVSVITRGDWLLGIALPGYQKQS